MSTLPVVVEAEFREFAPVPSGQADTDMQLVELWIGRHESQHTRRNYRRQAERFMALVGKPLGEVRLGDMQAYLATLADMAPATRANAAAALKSLFSFAQAIAEAADAGLARRGRALERRTGLLAALVLITALAGAGSAGWWAGREAGRSEVGAVAADVATVFRQGTDVADAWRDLIVWNDLRSALQTCRSPSENIMQAGRRTCRVPLWLSQAKSPSW